MTEGIKHDQEKPRIGFLLRSFPNAIREVALQNDYGAKKYSELNWMNVEYVRYEDALGRHYIEALEDGCRLDPESKQHHLAAVAWNALCLLELIKRTEAIPTEPEEIHESETKNETKGMDIVDGPKTFMQYCYDESTEPFKPDNVEYAKMARGYAKYLKDYGEGILEVNKEIIEHAETKNDLPEKPLSFDEWISDDLLAFPGGWNEVSVGIYKNKIGSLEYTQSEMDDLYQEYLNESND